MNRKAILQEKLTHAYKDQDQFLYWPAFYQKFSPVNCTVALAEEHREKNYFTFAYPYDHNLIKNLPFYINASPMKFGDHEYIATQGPRKTTLNDFWELIWLQNVRLIVSVTNEWEIDEAKIVPKFDAFWPKAELETYGRLRVENAGEELIQSWEDGRQELLRLRRLTLIHGDEKRDVFQLHMENWPDGDVIHPESLVTLSHQVDSLQIDGPIVVHCAAGIGRTGTFIAFHSLYHDMLNFLKEQDVDFDVSLRVEVMRQLRYGTMVADRRQFILLLEALEHALDNHL